MTPMLLFIFPAAGRPARLVALQDTTAINKDNNVFSLLILLLLPAVSWGQEWQLAMGEPIGRWPRRSTLSLLSDLTEHATAVHRFGTAPCGKRRQVGFKSDAYVFLHMYELKGSACLIGKKLF